MGDIIPYRRKSAFKSAVRPLFPESRYATTPARKSTSVQRFVTADSTPLPPLPCSCRQNTLALPAPRRPHPRARASPALHLLRAIRRTEPPGPNDPPVFPHARPQRPASNSVFVWPNQPISAASPQQRRRRSAPDSEISRHLPPQGLATLHAPTLLVVRYVRPLQRPFYARRSASTLHKPTAATP